MKLKVCGLTCPKSTYEVAQQVDYVGLNFCQASYHCLGPAQGKVLCSAASKGDAVAVGIFDNHSASDIVKLCYETGVDVVQLHGPRSRDEASQLPNNLTKIYVVELDQQGEIIEEHNLNYLDPDKDFILFDKPKSEKNTTIKLSQEVIKNFPFKYFIAGGITSENLSVILANLQPYAVDVSSGVEVADRQKDLTKIQTLRKHMEAI